MNRVSYVVNDVAGISAAIFELLQRLEANNADTWCSFDMSLLISIKEASAKAAGKQQSQCWSCDITPLNL